MKRFDTVSRNQAGSVPNVGDPTRPHEPVGPAKDIPPASQATQTPPMARMRVYGQEEFQTLPYAWSVMYASKDGQGYSGYDVTAFDRSGAIQKAKAIRKRNGGNPDDPIKSIDRGARIGRGGRPFAGKSGSKLGMEPYHPNEAWYAQWVQHVGTGEKKQVKVRARSRDHASRKALEQYSPKKGWRLDGEAEELGGRGPGRQPRQERTRERTRGKFSKFRVWLDAPGLVIDRSIIVGATDAEEAGDIAVRQSGLANASAKKIKQIM